MAEEQRGTWWHRSFSKLASWDDTQNGSCTLIDCVHWSRIVSTITLINGSVGVHFYKEARLEWCPPVSSDGYTVE